jgi:hypothetical protein
MILDDRLCKNLSILDSVVNSAYEGFKDVIISEDILPLGVDVLDEGKDAKVVMYLKSKGM